MKTHTLTLAALGCSLLVMGCGGNEGNTIAEQGITAEDIAQYEAELAAVTTEESYAEEENADDQ